VLVVRAPTRAVLLDARAGGGTRTSARATVNGTLDRIGLGRFHVALALVCGLGWLADSLWFTAIAAALPWLERERALSEAQLGALPAAAFLGAVLGALLFGAAADRLGRVPVFTLRCSSPFGGGALACVARTHAVLLLALALVGGGVGGNTPVDTALFAEFMPRATRGRLLTLLSIAWALGSVLAAALAAALLPRHGASACFGCLAAVTALGVLARVVARVPESPFFLARAHRPLEAAASLALVAARCQLSAAERASIIASLEALDTRVASVDELEAVHIAAADADGDAGDDGVASDDDGGGVLLGATGVASVHVDGVHARLPAVSASVAIVDAHKAAPGDAEYYSRTLRGWRWQLAPCAAYSTRAPLSLWLLWIVTAVGYGAVNLFMPERAAEAARAHPMTTTIVPSTSASTSTPMMYTAVNSSSTLAPGVAETDASSALSFFIYNLASVPGAFVGAILIEQPRFGRRRLLIASTLAAAVAAVGVFVAPTSLLSAVLFNCVSAIFWAALYVYTPEAFATAVRSSGVGVCTMMMTMVMTPPAAMMMMMTTTTTRRATMRMVVRTSRASARRRRACERRARSSRHRR